MRRSRIGERLGGSVQPVIAGIALLWVIEIVDWVISYPLDQWGIHPRSLWGLPGILFSPLLHGGFTHLIANTVPLFVLGVLISLRGTSRLAQVTSIVVCVGGASVWLFGKTDSVHIGASGLVFGYFGYLILLGLFDKKVGSLLLGILVLLMYGGLIWGVLPTDPHVSWEGHLFGLIAGGISARALSESRRTALR